MLEELVDALEEGPNSGGLEPGPGLPHAGEVWLRFLAVSAWGCKVRSHYPALF